MKTPAHAFREYDIRGVADRDLSDELAAAIGGALCAALRENAARENAADSSRLRIAVCRDCRLSSERLFAATVRGILSAGADVVDIGVGPTPLLYFAAHQLQTSGAVMVTGSHNPAEDNGFKLLAGKQALFGEAIAALRERIERGAYEQRGTGEHARQDVSGAYLEAIAAKTRFSRPPNELRLVVDGGNGVAGPLALAALSRIGARPEAMFCEPDGRFPNHHPDPTVEANLAALRARVLASGALFGIALDGDGDRIGVVDDAGGVIWGDKLMILFARAVLAEHPGAAILGEVKCSQTLFDDIAAKGGRPIVARTGHSLIKKRMKDEGALLGGEMSGHIFFADRYFGFDDATYAAARLLEIVAATGRSPRELLADVPKTAATPELRVVCPDAVKFEVVARVLAHYRGSHEVIDVDGARIGFGDGAWGLCRASNTGPVLVLRFEAKTEAHRDAIRAEVEAVVARALGEIGR